MLRLLLPVRLILMVVFGNLLSSSHAPAQSKLASSSTGSAVTDDRSALEKETFFLVNQYRKANKLPPLEWDDTVATVARHHSRDMAVGQVDFGHDGFGDRVRQLQTVMTGLQAAGENILMTGDPQQAARQAVSAWLKSPHHLKNIRDNFNYSGLGVWLDDKGEIYFTQIFVRIVPPVKAAPNPPPGIVTPFGFLATPNSR